MPSKEHITTQIHNIMHLLSRQLASKSLQQNKQTQKLPVMNHEKLSQNFCIKPSINVKKKKVCWIVKDLQKFNRLRMSSYIRSSDKIKGWIEIIDSCFGNATVCQGMEPWKMKTQWLKVKPYTRQQTPKWTLLTTFSCLLYLHRTRMERKWKHYKRAHTLKIIFPEIRKYHALVALECWM